jgi:hypothetical protein
MRLSEEGYKAQVMIFFRNYEGMHPYAFIKQPKPSEAAGTGSNAAQGDIMLSHEILSYKRIHKKVNILKQAGIRSNPAGIANHAHLSSWAIGLPC